jgi:glycosyltransferase involved in cell wall biosynthesis
VRNNNSGHCHNRPPFGCTFTFYCTGGGLSHLFLSICRGLDAELDPQLIVPGCAPEYRDPRVIEAVPRAVRKLVLRSPGASRFVTERRLLREAKHLNAFYLFPAVTLGTIKRLRKTGKPVFLERVNCALQTAARVLDKGYRRLQVPPAHGITPAMVAKEREEIAHVAYVVCPSAHVYNSFVEFGIPEEKLIASSYGWAPGRFPDRPAPRLHAGRLSVLFVGSVCVRKGAHLLLEAWSRSGVDGELVLCGDIEPAITAACGHLLARADVVHVPFTRDIGAFYRRAHLFAFPTLEEGGPLVTPEAMAHGLPILTSPMGAGAYVRDGCEGRVLDPYDTDAWVDVLREAYAAPALYAQFGAAAQLRAQEFTWDRVAKARGLAFMQRLGMRAVTAGNDEILCR